MPTKRGGNSMKLLKIESDLGFFKNREGDFSPIDQITKEDILRLLDSTLSEDVEFDKYDEESIKHQAHQILYKSISEKLINTRERKQEFQDESERLFLKEYEKYKNSILKQEEDADDTSCPT